MNRVSKVDLCDSCRKIRQRMNDGSFSDTVEELLECVGYKKPEGTFALNPTLLFFLEDNGGCNSCKNLFR